MLNEATDPYSPFAPLTHLGTFLPFTSLVTFLVYRARDVGHLAESSALVLRVSVDELRAEIQGVVVTPHSP